MIGNQIGRGMSTIEALDVRIDLAAPLSGARRGRHTVAKRPAEKPGEETAKLPTETPQPGPANPPAGKPDKAQQIVQFLQLPPAELAGKHGMKVTTKDGTALDFTPCRPEPTKDIVEKFGQPDHIAIPHLSGEGPDGQKTQLAWQLWIYGKVMFFVDETGAARYYSLVPRNRTSSRKRNRRRRSSVPCCSALPAATGRGFHYCLGRGVGDRSGAPLRAQMMPRGSGRQPAVQPKQVDVQGTFEGVVEGGSCCWTTRTNAGKSPSRRAPRST